MSCVLYGSYVVSEGRGDCDERPAQAAPRRNIVHVMIMLGRRGVVPEDGTESHATLRGITTASTLFMACL